MQELALPSEIGRQLAPNEERYIMAEVLTGAVLMMPTVRRLEGPLDKAALEGALNRLVQQKSALRHTYFQDPAGIWMRRVAVTAPLAMQFVDMPGASFDTVRAAVEPNLFARIDFSPNTLRRVVLVRTAPEVHWLIIALHHAICDGTSVTALISDLFALYAGESPLVETLEYGDLFADNWRSSEAYANSLDYWRQALTGRSAGFDHPGEFGGASQVETPKEVVIPIDGEAASRIAAAAAKIGVSAFQFHYAAVLVVLSRLTGESRPITAFQSAGRRNIAASDRVMGCFSNALPLSVEVDPRQSFAALARAVRTNVKDALSNERVPAQDIIQATGVHAQVGVNWLPVRPPLTACRPSVHIVGEIARPSDYRLNFRYDNDDDGLRLVLHYRGDQFSRGLIEAVALRTLAVAEQASADAEAPVRNLVRVEQSASPRIASVTAGEAIHAAFLRHAASTPTAPAVSFDGRSLDYATVERQSRVLAHRLGGLDQGAIVAVLAERGPALVIAMLGVSRAGLGFAMLDAALPEAQLRVMMATAGIVAVIGAGILPSLALARHLAQEAGVPLFDVPRGQAHEAQTLVERAPSTIAYLLFTSGTTGVPRCVATGSDPIVSFCRWQREHFGLSSNDRFTLLSGLSHDPMMRDIFGALSAGGEICIPHHATLAKPRALAQWFAAARPTVTHLTPPLGRLLLEDAQDGACPSLRLVFWGGDILRPAQTAAMTRFAPNSDNVNFYGTSETPQAVAFHVAEPDGDRLLRSVPIGSGANGAEIIVEAGGRRCATGELGELIVITPNLSLGYVENGALVPHSDGMRYPTGDIGFHRLDGEILYCGRGDDQVKIRGYRVELNDVVSGLLQDENIIDAAVIACGDLGDQWLHAFVIMAKDDEELPVLLARLAKRRPAQLVPARISRVAAIPLQANGKTDYRQLGRQASEDEAPRSDVEDHSLLEREIASSWSRILRQPVTDMNANFAAIGGDSLSQVHAFLALEEAIGEPPEGWQFRAIRELAGSPQAHGRSKVLLLDLPIVLRALGLLAIIAGHIGLIRYGGGVTGGLFIISGYLIGSLQLGTVESSRSAGRLWKYTLELFLASLVGGAIILAAKYLDGDQPDPWQIMLVGDFYSYAGVSGSGRLAIHLWYIHAMVHMMFLLSGAFWLGFALLRRPKSDPFVFVLTLFGFAMGLRYVAPAMVVSNWFAAGLPLGSWIASAPTTHLATLILGMLLATADTPARKAIAYAMLLIDVLASAYFFATNAWIFTLVAGLLLMLAKPVPIPRLVARLMLLLAGNSLFIYMLHPLGVALALRLGTSNSLVLVISAILIGVLAGKLWRAFEHLTTRRKSHEPSIELSV